MSRLFQVAAPDFQILQACPRPVSIDTRDLSHINLDPPRIVSPSTSRGDTNMRKFIFIAGFVLASAAAQAGDRSLSLGGGVRPRALRRQEPSMHREPRKSRRLRKPRNMSSGPRSSSPSPRRSRNPGPRRPGPRRAGPRRARSRGRPASAGRHAARHAGRPRAPEPAERRPGRAAMMSRSAAAAPHALRDPGAHHQRAAPARHLLVICQSKTRLPDGHPKARCLRKAGAGETA